MTIHNPQSLDTMQAENTLSSLSIIKLGESLIGPDSDEVTRDATRMSDASSNAPQGDAPTAASLEADLTHYKVFRSWISDEHSLNILLGTLHQVTIQLRRASHQGKVSPRSRRGSAIVHLSIRKRRSRITPTLYESYFESAKDRSGGAGS